MSDDGGVRRVAVVGPGGAGKSTFAAGLGRLTGLPVVHLDRHSQRLDVVRLPSRRAAGAFLRHLAAAGR